MEKAKNDHLLNCFSSKGFWFHLTSMLNWAIELHCRACSDNGEQVLVNFKDGSFKDRWLPLWNQSSICSRVFRKPIQAAENEKFSYSTQEGQIEGSCGMPQPSWWIFHRIDGCFGGIVWVTGCLGDGQTQLSSNSMGCRLSFPLLAGDPRGKKSVYFKDTHFLRGKWNQGDTTLNDESSLTVIGRKEDWFSLLSSPRI